MVPASTGRSDVSDLVTPVTPRASDRPTSPMYPTVPTTSFGAGSTGIPRRLPSSCDAANFRISNASGGSPGISFIRASRNDRILLISARCDSPMRRATSPFHAERAWVRSPSSSMTGAAGVPTRTTPRRPGPSTSKYSFAVADA